MVIMVNFEIAIFPRIQTLILKGVGCLKSQDVSLIQGFGYVCWSGGTCGSSAPVSVHNKAGIAVGSGL